MPVQRLKVQVTDAYKTLQTEPHTSMPAVELAVSMGSLLLPGAAPTH